MLRGDLSSENNEAQMSLKLNNFEQENYERNPDYKAGVTLHTHSSRGQMRRYKSRTTGEVVYTQSLLEYKALITLDCDPRVIDIEEQYKHDLQHTLSRAFELGINHPPQNQVEKVNLTTDFVVTIAEPEICKVGIYVKYLKDLDNNRTIEKLQLERDSLAHHSIPIYIVTEQEIDQQTHLTLEWILGETIDESEIEELLTFKSGIEEIFQMNPDRRISESLVCLDEKQNLPGGTHLGKFKKLVQIGEFSFEFHKEFFELLGEDIEPISEVFK